MTAPSTVPRASAEVAINGSATQAVRTRRLDRVASRRRMVIAAFT